MATQKVTEITTEAQFAQHTSSLPPSALAVIYFHAPWAAPCQQMAGVVEALASTYPSEPSSISISFLSLNAEELPEISEQYDVTAVPYIVLQRGGQTLETVSGSDASKVRAAVERHAGKTGNPGKTGLPPPQTVTRPAQPTMGDGAPLEGANGAKDLGSYAADSSDAQTVPNGQPSKEELFKRLEGLVKAAPVMLFMKGTPSAPQCGFSRQTVSMLRERTIRYGFFNILADDEVRQGLKEYAEWPTFPQLWVDGELVGGLDIVKEEFENNPDFLQEYSVKPQAASVTT